MHHVNEWVVRWIIDCGLINTEGWKSVNQPTYHGGYRKALNMHGPAGITKSLS